MGLGSGLGSGWENVGKGVGDGVEGREGSAWLFESRSQHVVSNVPVPLSVSVTHSPWSDSGSEPRGLAGAEVQRADGSGTSGGRR